MKQHTTQALVVRAETEQLVCIGQKWYPTPRRDMQYIDIDPYILIQFGHFQSVRPTQKQTINIDGKLLLIL